MEDFGQRGGGAARREVFLDWVEAMQEAGEMPEDPRHDHRAHRVAPPAKLPAGADDERRVRILLGCYRGAMQYRFGRKVGVGLRGDLRKARFWASLVRAAALLDEHEIAPAAWAAWSVNVWRTQERGSKAPPVTWVFAPARLAKPQNRGWFRSTSSMADVVKLVWPESERRLTQGYARLLASLRVEWEPGCGPEVLDRSLGVALGVPADEAREAWRGLEQAAQRDRARAEATLKGAPRTGEVWLWE